MSSLNDVRWISLPTDRDARGALTSIENNIDIPFDLKRIFYIHDIISDRGGHAHTDTDQMAIAIAGSFCFRLSDDRSTTTFLLDDRTKGLYLPRMVFVDIEAVAADSVCLVLASTHYEARNSLRSYQDYVNELQSRQ